MPYISEKDEQDLLFGIKENVDFVAASFVRSAENVIELRRFLDYHGGHSIKIIAKIENMAPIRTKTSKQQRAFFYANKDKFLGADRKGGWMASVGRQGMYDGTKSLANFRKTTAARKSMDKAKTYGRAGKSRYIMAIGQDGHAR